MKYPTYFKHNLKNSLLLLLILLIGYLAACGDSKPTSSNPGKVSTATGKPFNQPGGFQVGAYTGQQVGPVEGPGRLVYIDGGSIVLGLFDGSIQGPKREVTVTSYYLKETEVTNIEWNEYLDYLQKKDTALFEAALPDEKVWERALGYNDPFISNYRRGKGFRFYPVVGVSWVQANAYCKWLTDQLNESIAKKAGKTYDPENPTGGDDQSIESDLVGIGYRLPTEAEWEYAARAIIGTQDLNLVQSTQRVYPWGDGLSLRGKEGEWKGKYLANFKRSKGNYKGVPGESHSDAPTCEVWDYPPNDLGLYDMGGNVSEWVYDVYRPLSYQDFDDFNPVRRDDTLDPAKDYEAANSLIDNNARVYKGASWRDSAYWAQIGTRRYLDEKSSSATIGFRYAITSLGKQAE